MSGLAYARPGTLAEAQALAADAPTAGEGDRDGRLWLAGGQSLLAAMRLGLVSPSMLIDLQALPGLRDIRLEGGDGAAPALLLGALATHAGIAASERVKRHAPGLAALAGGIADEQVRQMGTIGGSLAHNDPAACWPAGVLAANATVVTDRREIPADRYFRGLYATALQPGELILGVRFPPLEGLHYLKFEQPASRFALVGVAVARSAAGALPRVAVTGLGQGVTRWPAAEQALAGGFSVAALQALADDGAHGLEARPALSDLHASAAYRRHLAWVLARRCVAALGGGPLPPHAPLARTAHPVPQARAPLPTAQAGGAAPASAPASAPTSASTSPPDEADADGFGGVQLLEAPPAQVWPALLDPGTLQRSLPGCEALVQTRADTYEARVKVGLGPLSVRFSTEVQVRDPHPPGSLTLVFKGQAGALGSGQGTAQVRLEPVGAARTRLHWRVQVQLSGRLAQFGTRLVEATARELSGVFFERLGQTLAADSPQGPAAPRALPRWRRLLRRLRSWVGA